MAGDLERISYEAALRALDKQEQLVEGLRSRTVVLLGASLFVATFTAQASVDRAGSGAIVALVCFAFLAAMCASVVVLAPRRGLTFSLSGHATYTALYVLTDDVAEIHRRLVHELHCFWVGNDATISLLSSWYRVAVMALLLETFGLVTMTSDSIFAA